MAHERGAKDVVYVGENESVRWSSSSTAISRYMIHCHNLTHEDHDMMGQFEIRDDVIAAHDPMGDPASRCPRVTEAVTAWRALGHESPVLRLR